MFSKSYIKVQNKLDKWDSNINLTVDAADDKGYDDDTVIGELRAGRAAGN